jgi:hypothetical protein
MRTAALALLVAAVTGAARAAPSLAITAIYEARLMIKVADLRTDQVVTPDGYKAGARLTTIGALGIIKPSTILAQADGGVAGGAPAPVAYLQTEKNKRRVTRYAAGGGGRSLADPLTQLLRAALQPGDGSPCVGALPVYDGRQRYDLTLNPAGGGTLAGPPAHFGLTHPLACRLGFHPISGFSGGPPKKNPFVRADPTATFAFEPRARVWMLTDVAVPTLVGTGHIALTSVHINGARPALTGPAPTAAPRRSRRRR